MKTSYLNCTMWLNSQMKHCNTWEGAMVAIFVFQYLTGPLLPLFIIALPWVQNLWTAGLWGNGEVLKQPRTHRRGRADAKNHAIPLMSCIHLRWKAAFSARKLSPQSLFPLLKVEINTHTQRKKAEATGKKEEKQKKKWNCLINASCVLPEAFPFACTQRETFLSGQRTPFTGPLVKQGQMHPANSPLSCERERGEG